MVSFARSRELIVPSSMLHRRNLEIFDFKHKSWAILETPLSLATTFRSASRSKNDPKESSRHGSPNTHGFTLHSVNFTKRVLNLTILFLRLQISRVVYKCDGPIPLHSSVGDPNRTWRRTLCCVNGRANVPQPAPHYAHLGAVKLRRQEPVGQCFDNATFACTNFPAEAQIGANFTRPNRATRKLQFPIRAQFGCSLGSTLLVAMLVSSLGRVYSRQANTWNCENSAVSFVMKYCPISTTIRNHASTQNLLDLSCCDSFSIRSSYRCNRKSWYAGSSQSEGTSVLITLSASEEFHCPITTDRHVLSWKGSYSSHNSATAP